MKQVRRTYSKKLPIDSLYSLEAEKGVLGSCLIAPSECISACAESITSDYFFIPAHKAIYEVLIELWNKNTGIDLITFTQTLKDRQLLDEVGGEAAITELFVFVPSASNIGYYIDIITDRYVLREVIGTCEFGLTKAATEPDNPQLIISEMQTMLLAASQGRGIEKKTIHDYAMGAMEALEEAHRLKGKLPGYSTGLIDLDRQLGGLIPPQLIIIAGETGGGKTALALKIASHNAIDHRIPTGFISLEMSGEELSERMIARVGKVDLHNMVTRGGSNLDLIKIPDAVKKISESPLYICDESDMTFTKLRAVGREMKREHDIQILVVDYIQLMNTDVDDSNREQIVSTAAASLKQMAKELNIVVIALSQLNDQGMLRESRAIGHHADKVLKIKMDKSQTGVAWLSVEKNRKGPIGTVSAVFIPAYTDFADRAKSNDDF